MQENTRLSFSVFPKFTQPFWTWLTGKPLENEQPLFEPSPWLYLLISVGIFAISITLGIMALANPQISVFWLILSLPGTVYGARLMVLTISHQCAHQMFSQSKLINQIVHDTLTTMVCSQDYDSYRHDHFYIHHGIKTFGTFEDPVLSFIRQLGFRENMTRGRLWIQLIWTLISPKFHSLYLLNRLGYNFFGGRVLRRIFAIFWWGSIATILWLFPSYFSPVFIAYILPVTFFYNISAFLELICEHVWMRPIGKAIGRQRITELSWGRFCGETVPAQGAGFFAWVVWTLRMIFYHLPTRLLVLTGDAPQHDFHHCSPNTRDWTISAYARRNLIANGKMEDREIWGLIAAIDIVFEQMSIVSASTSSTAYLSNVSTPKNAPVTDATQI